MKEVLHTNPLCPRYPWRVEWVDLKSGIHYNRDFTQREIAEIFYGNCLSDREFLESIHSISLNWVEFIQPRCYIMHALKVYRNYPDEERRIK